jgi:hypothetical protein
VSTPEAQARTVLHDARLESGVPNTGSVAAPHLNQWLCVSSSYTGKDKQKDGGQANQHKKGWRSGSSGRAPIWPVQGGRVQPLVPPKTEVNRLSPRHHGYKPCAIFCKPLEHQWILVCGCSGTNVQIPTNNSMQQSSAPHFSRALPSGSSGHPRAPGP